MKAKGEVSLQAVASNTKYMFRVQKLTLSNILSIVISRQFKAPSLDDLSEALCL